MPAKTPQDHKPKKSAADKLRAESKGGAGGISRQIALTGRRGEVTVTVLPDPMDWGIEATDLLDVWSKRDPATGGVTAAEMRSFLCAIVSVEDADRIRAIEPTQRSLSDAADAILATDDEAEDLGESQAS